jgi:arylsulfatase A-like enzyme
LAAVLSPSVEPLALVILAAVLGGGGGLAIYLLHRGLGFLPRPLRLPTYLLLGALSALLAFALPLGAWTKLRGPHATMAAGALLAAVVAGALGGGLLHWTGQEPGPKPAHRWLDLLKSAAFPGGLLLFALAFAAYEATQAWLRTYPSARQGLFFAAWLCATVGVLAGTRLLREPGQRVLSWATAVWVALALVSLPFVDASTWGTLARVPHAEGWISLGRSLSDFDRDGFSGWLGGGDCAPFDAKVSPGAREWPGNGVDDNCRYGDAPLMPPPAPVPSLRMSPPEGALDIVLITVDALRADHTTPYGYARNTTPNLAEFAKSAVRYEHAYTSGGWTCLAVSSLFSGVYPRRMRWSPLVWTDRKRLLDVPYRLEASERVEVVLTLPTEAPPWWLPLALQQRGYHTVAIANRLVKPMFSRAFARGWERIPTDDGIEDVVTVDVALQELEHLPSPYFLWIHLFDPHEPQTPHLAAPTFGPSLIDEYDHEVASMDHELGRILRALDSRPNTALIFTADHGESFINGFQLHGIGLWEDAIHIPLLVRAPGWQPALNASPASLVDLAPTILGFAQMPVPVGLDGRNLRGLRGNAAVLSDLFRMDEQGHVTLDEMTATNSSLRLWHDGLKQSDLLVKTGDLTLPPRGLYGVQPPAELSDALARHIEASIPPTGASP